MNSDLVGHARESLRKALDPIDEECCIAKARPFRAPGANRQRIGAGVYSDGERGRLGPRTVENVAAVTRTHVHKNVAERSG